MSRARRTDPGTSHAAGDRQHGQRADTIRIKVLSIIQAYGPMTDEELLRRYQMIDPDVAESSPRKRRGELVESGLVLDYDVNGVTSKGSKAIRWTASP